MVNKVILIGNVGADPEVRTLESGVKVARVRLATTERMYMRATQETKDHTEWHSVTLWRGLADVADRYVKKGSQIYIEGRIRSREWTDESGAKRYGIEILADDMKLLGRREGASTGGSYDAQSQGGGYNTPSQGGYSAPTQGGYSAPASQPQSAPAPSVIQDDPDDLPF